MVGLKPIDHDTQLIYQCPKCGIKHFKLVSEVTRPNAAIHCDCGIITEILQLKEPRFVAKFVKQKEEIASLTERDMRVAHRCVEAYYPDAPHEMAVRLNKAMTKDPKTWQDVVAFALEATYP